MNISIQIKIIAAMLVLVFFIVAPDFMLTICHSIIVGLFEVLEVLLDKVVEHLFHTDRHTTQLIVFYLLWAMFLVVLRKSWLMLRKNWQRVKRESPRWWQQTTTHIAENWHACSLRKKLKWILGSIVGAYGVMVLLF